MNFSQLTKVSKFFRQKLGHLSQCTIMYLRQTLGHLSQCTIIDLRKTLEVMEVFGNTPLTVN